MATILLEESLEIPDGIHTLADFRRWTYRNDFPERGRIDYIDGRIEIDMSPEWLYSHGRLKVELVGVMGQLTKELELGEVFSDSTRVASAAGGVSAEPDLVFISHESIESGRIRLIPKSGDEGDFIEIDGPPDLIVEIVSDGSVTKDTRRLPKAYFEAGVMEYWLIDGRRESLAFSIQHRGENGFVPASRDHLDYQPSLVLGRRFRLDRRRNKSGHWQYDLLHAE